MIRVYDSLIDENAIIGLGSFLRTEKEASITFHFEIYLMSYKIEISSFAIEIFDSENKNKIFKRITDEYRKLETAVLTNDYEEYL